jgi:hypothetical protein
MADNEFYQISPLVSGENIHGLACVYSEDDLDYAWFALVQRYYHDVGANRNYGRFYLKKITDLTTLDGVDINGPYLEQHGPYALNNFDDWYTGRKFVVSNSIIWYMLTETTYPDQWLYIYKFDASVPSPSASLEYTATISQSNYYGLHPSDILADPDTGYLFFVTSEKIIRWDGSFTELEPNAIDLPTRISDGAWNLYCCMTKFNGLLYLCLQYYNGIDSEYLIMSSDDNGDTWSTVLTYSPGDYDDDPLGDGCFRSMTPSPYMDYIYMVKDPAGTGYIYKWDGTADPPIKVATSSLGAYEYQVIVPSLDGAKLWIGGADEDESLSGIINELDLSDDSITQIYGPECEDCVTNDLLNQFSTAWFINTNDENYPDGILIWISSALYDYVGLGAGKPNEFYGAFANEYDYVSFIPPPVDPPGPSGSSEAEIPHEYEGQILQQGRGYGRAYEMRVTGGNIIISYNE